MGGSRWDAGAGVAFTTGAKRRGRCATERSEWHCGCSGASAKDVSFGGAAAGVPAGLARRWSRSDHLSQLGGRAPGVAGDRSGRLLRGLRRALQPVMQAVGRSCRSAASTLSTCSRSHP